MKLDRIGLGPKSGPSILPVFGAAVIFPLTVVFWIFNYFVQIITRDDETEGPESVPPSRWLMSLGFPIAFTLYGLRKKSLNESGALLGLVVGFFLTISNYCFLASLMVFFFTSSKATKYGTKIKRRIEHDFKEGGQRNWVQVLCNGGMATELAILYLLDVGHGQLPINFHQHYRASWLALGVLGALSCANGDTWASELGSVIGSGSPRLVTSWRKVPKGTNGGVSLAGLFFSLLGGIVVGLGFYLVLIFTADRNILEESSPQWPVIVAGGIGGFLGSYIDSFIGATLQFSGVDDKGVVMEKPGPNVRHVSGWPVLDNHSVNLISTIIMGLLLPVISFILWPNIS